MSALALNAEALYPELLRGVRGLCKADTRLVGITSGGAWLAERLHRDLGLAGESGQVSSVMHRDDYAQRGLSAGGQTHLPFEVDGADILVLDDVLYTGRTIRAVLNEIFDYGRPARVQLAVLVDRGGVSCRCKPILRRPGWLCPRHNRWRWPAMPRVHSVLKWRTRPEKVKKHALQTQQPPTQ